METIYFAAQNPGSISGIQEPIIEEYFRRLNRSDFAGVASLFSSQGCLYPPFEKPICGQEAILQYLQTEAIAILAMPKFCKVQEQQDGHTVYQITGQVKTNFFTVNVGWSIQLNAENALVTVEVKLLAELQDLLNLKRN